MNFNALSRPAPPPPAQTPRRVRKPIDAREWLEDMRRFNGRDADFAGVLLNILDEVENGDYDDENALCDIAEKSGDTTLDTIDDVANAVKELKDLRLWADRDATFREFSGVEDEKLDSRMEAFARSYDKLEAQADALRALAVDAGLINASDHQTDPLPLLRMFLPID